MTDEKTKPAEDVDDEIETSDETQSEEVEEAGDDYEGDDTEAEEPKKPS